MTVDIIEDLKKKIFSAAQKKGYIAIVGGRASNFPTWVLSLPKKIKLLEPGDDLSSNCVLAICTRFLDHGAWEKVRAWDAALPGIYQTGQLRNALEANRRLLEGVVDDQPAPAELVEQAPKGAPDTILVPAKRARRGDRKAFIELVGSRIHTWRAQGCSVADIAMKLLVEIKEHGIECTLDSLESGIYLFLRENKVEQMATLRRIAQSVTEGTAKEIRVISPNAPPGSVQKPLIKTVEVVTTSASDDVAAAFAVVQAHLGKFAELQRENEQLKEKVSLLEKKLANIREMMVN